jgi:hypothetical protein
MVDRKLVECCQLWKGRGLYILENFPPRGEEISALVIWGKNVKSGREKGGRCKRKRKKGERQI